VARLTSNGAGARNQRVCVSPHTRAPRANPGPFGRGNILSDTHLHPFRRLGPARESHIFFLGTLFTISGISCITSVGSAWIL
jgi:hypothetical protein